MTIRYSTNFDGADANPIGAPFSVFPFFDTFGNVKRSGNLALGTGAGLRNSVYLPSVDVGAVHHYASITVGNLGAGGGLMALAYVGIDPTGSIAWSCGIDDGGVTYINRNTGAGFNTLTTGAHTHTPGDVYTGECYQSGADVHIILRVNGAIALTAIDPSRTMGPYCGLMLRNDDCEGLAYEIGDFLLPASLSFQGIGADINIETFQPATWSSKNGGIKGTPAGNAVTGSGGADSIVAYAGDSATPGQYAEVDIPLQADASPFIGVACRVSADGDAYGAIWASSSGSAIRPLYLNTYENGNFIGLFPGGGGSDSIGVDLSGKTLRLEMLPGGGAFFRVLVDGVEIYAGSATASATWLTGDVGIAAYQAGGTYATAWRGGNIAAPVGTTASVDFSTLAADETLAQFDSSKWSSPLAKQGYLTGSTAYPGALRPKGAGGGQDTLARYLDIAPGADQFAEVVVQDATPASGSGDGWIGPAVRLDGAFNGYGAVTNPSIGTYVNKYVNGVFSGPALVGPLSPIAAGSVMRLEVEGTTLRLYDDGALIATVSDASFADGLPGIAGAQDNTPERAVATSWAAGALAPSPGGDNAGPLTSSKRLKSLTGGALCN